MTFIIPIIIALFLLLISILDLKFKAIPSVLLTAILFTIAFLYPQGLWFGIMGGIMALLLFEIGFFSGIADIKVMAMLGFMIPTTNWLFAFILLTMVYGFVWTNFYKWRTKSKEIAFIPVFFFCYVTLWLLGGFS